MRVKTFAVLALLLGPVLPAPIPEPEPEPEPQMPVPDWLAIAGVGTGIVVGVASAMMSCWNIKNTVNMKNHAEMQGIFESEARRIEMILNEIKALDPKNRFRTDTLSQLNHIMRWNDQRKMDVHGDTPAATRIMKQYCGELLTLGDRCQAEKERLSTKQNSIMPPPRRGQAINRKPVAGGSSSAERQGAHLGPVETRPAVSPAPGPSGSGSFTVSDGANSGGSGTRRRPDAGKETGDRKGKQPERPKKEDSKDSGSSSDGSWGKSSGIQLKKMTKHE